MTDSTKDILNAALYHLLDTHGPVVLNREVVEALPDEMAMRLSVVDGQIKLSVATEEEEGV